MGFEIRDHLAKLQPDGGTNTPMEITAFSAQCRAVEREHQGEPGTGKWAAYGCKCSSTEKKSEQSVRLLLQQSKGRKDDRTANPKQKGESTI